jgi:hypothetical protein
MYEISSLDHLAAKVDALTQKFDKKDTSAVTPAHVSPLCEVCGVFCNTLLLISGKTRKHTNIF